MTKTLWFRDRRTWLLIAFGFLPWLGLLNLAWEAVHVRLYTLWDEANAAYIAFSVVHCTLGDVLIGGLALMLSLIFLRQPAAAHWRWGKIAALTVVLGVAYTAFSEWMNLTILRSWAYAETMPTVALGDMEIGLSPLLQWIVLPPLALSLARKVSLAGGPAKPAHQHHE